MYYDLINQKVKDILSKYDIIELPNNQTIENNFQGKRYSISDLEYQYEVVQYPSYLIFTIQIGFIVPDTANNKYRNGMVNIFESILTDLTNRDTNKSFVNFVTNPSLTQVDEDNKQHIGEIRVKFLLNANCR